MTDCEIRLELAKVAMEHGKSVCDANMFYKWVTQYQVPEEKCGDDYYNSMTIFQLLRNAGVSRNLVRIMNACKNNNINNVGDLLKLGGWENAVKMGGIGTDSLRDIENSLSLLGVRKWNYHNKVL